MTILIAALVFCGLIAAFALTQALRRNGLAGCLDLLAAAIISTADAIRAAQGRYAETIRGNRAWAEERRP